jgi:hypothetical protein
VAGSSPPQARSTALGSDPSWRRAARPRSGSLRCTARMCGRPARPRFDPPQCATRISGRPVRSGSRSPRCAARMRGRPTRPRSDPPRCATRMRGRADGPGSGPLRCTARGRGRTARPGPLRYTAQGRARTARPVPLRCAARPGSGPPRYATRIPSRTARSGSLRYAARSAFGPSRRRAAWAGARRAVVARGCPAASRGGPLRDEGAGRLRAARGGALGRQVLGWGGEIGHTNIGEGQVRVRNPVPVVSSPMSSESPAQVPLTNLP